MYPVAFEIAGPMALFNRPDSGSTPVSYPVPTWSALKGMFEAVARIQGAFVKPQRVEICAPIRFAQYTTNYGGPLRNSKQLAKNAPYQLRALVLIDVCYKVFGNVSFYEDHPDGINARHALQEAFTRRISAGQCLYTPCLGWKEFAPSYFGPLRPNTSVDVTVNLVLPSLLHSVFDQPKLGRRSPYFHQDVAVTDGVLVYRERSYAERSV